MDRATAITKLRKLLGKNMGYRVDPKAPTPDEREEAQAAIKPACDDRDKAQAARDARRAELLKNDAEFQRLAAEATAASERVQKLGATARHYKITVGRSRDVAGLRFFSVAAEGDSWEQVIAKIEKKGAGL